MERTEPLVNPHQKRCLSTQTLCPRLSFKPEEAPEGDSLSEHSAARKREDVRVETLRGFPLAVNP